MSSPSLGESQSALLTVRHMRALLACDGWPALQSHLLAQRDQLARRVLDDDSLPSEAREHLRTQYKVYRDLLPWPQSTLDAQLSVLEHSRTRDPDSQPSPAPLHD